MNPVFLFSGQGSQKPGMGADLMGVPEVASSFDCASDVLGYDLADIRAFDIYPTTHHVETVALFRKATR